MNPYYIHLLPESEMPRLPFATPFRAVVIIEEKPSVEWQYRVSRWLVEHKCLYMMAWGIDATTWDDSVDEENIARFNYEDIPDEHFVMTTWHDDQTLDEVFWFCGNCAEHSTVEIQETIFIHIAEVADGESLIARFHLARHDDSMPD